MDGDEETVQVLGYIITFIFLLIVFMSVCCCGIAMCIYYKYRNCRLDYENLERAVR